MATYNLTDYERTEAWLDDNSDFAHSYFVRKATREMVNAWFAERVHTSNETARDLNLVHNLARSEIAIPGTPTRKISASEFDRPLRPILVKDSEGSLTFVFDSDRKDQMPLKVRKPACEATPVDDQCSRLLELVRDISSHLDVTTLCHKIFLHINEVISADRYSLFLVHEDSSNEKFLVSRLFDVAEGSTPEEASTNCIRIEWNKGIVGYVAATGEPLNIKDAYKDPRFNAEVDQITGYKTQSILSMPIKNHKGELKEMAEVTEEMMEFTDQMVAVAETWEGDGERTKEVVGVAQAINKKCATHGTFTKNDEKDFAAYLTFCGIVLHNAKVYETSRLENRRNQVLLDLATLIFEEQHSLEVILKKIAATILSFIQAQSCTIFIVDDNSSDSFSNVFHMNSMELDDPAEFQRSRNYNINKINYMFAKYAKNTMETLNITDLSKDKRFMWTNENAESTNKQIKSLLCTPIKNGKKNKVIDLNSKKEQFLCHIGLDLASFLEVCFGSNLDSFRNVVEIKLLDTNAGRRPKCFQCRLGKAKNVFQLMSNIWRSTKYSKVKLYQSCVLSTLSYGSECWHMTERDLAKLSSFHNLLQDPLCFLAKKDYNHDMAANIITCSHSCPSGVCQLVNKIGETFDKIKAFNKNDEQFLEAFAIFCGLGIQNTQMYETVEMAMAKQMVTLEVLSYHASATENETEELQVTAVKTVPSAHSLKLLDFSFSDFDLSEVETTLAAIRMFTDLNCLQNFQMKYEVLCRWILTVKKNYRRHVAYHNWRHAFNTTQCMFAVLKSGRIQSKLTDLEILALIIATLSHDLDHRGVNNAFIKRSEHPLAQLYCHSMMEHHHFDQCVMILNTPGNQILSSLSLDEYKATLKMVEKAILATDLAVYMKRREEFFDLVKTNQFTWEDKSHKELLMAMLMTACDVSAITKPWPVQQKTAELVATEFFQQGDKEREELNIEPIDLMNREKRDQIPSMQVGFIDAICIQLYEALATISEACLPLLEGCRSNRRNWEMLAAQNLLNGEKK